QTLAEQALRLAKAHGKVVVGIGRGVKSVIFRKSRGVFRGSFLETIRPATPGLPVGIGRPGRRREGAFEQGLLAAPGRRKILRGGEPADDREQTETCQSRAYTNGHRTNLQGHACVLLPSIVGTDSPMVRLGLLPANARLSILV